MASAKHGPSRDLLELIFGYGLSLLVLWTPEFPQLLLSAVSLFATLAIVLARRPTRDQLGLGVSGLLPSWWILAAAAALAALGITIAKRLGTLHPLYEGDFTHIAGYVLWTLYQQFLLQDYFMPRLLRLVPMLPAVIVASLLFAVAHLPNPVLTPATLLWGVISCFLFLRVRNLYALGLSQGLFGLCIGICIPDAMHHHLRVGLGYLR